MTDYKPNSVNVENELRSAAKFKWVHGVTDLYECPECFALVAGGGWRGHAEWHKVLNEDMGRSFDPTSASL